MIYERGGISAVGSIFPRVLPNEPDGTIDLKSIELNIPSFIDPHVNPIRSISLEST